VGCSRFCARRPKWPIDTDQTSKNADEQTSSYKKGDTSSSGSLARVTSGPELEDIIAVCSFGHSIFFHFRTFTPRHRARFPDDFQLFSREREGAA